MHASRQQNPYTPFHSVNIINQLFIRLSICPPVPSVFQASCVQTNNFLSNFQQLKLSALCNGSHQVGYKKMLSAFAWEYATNHTHAHTHTHIQLACLLVIKMTPARLIMQLDICTQGYCSVVWIKELSFICSCFLLLSLCRAAPSVVGVHFIFYFRKN